MQSKEEHEIDAIKQPCPRCGGKGTVLVNVYDYMNRVEKRAAKKAHVQAQQFLPCPECHP